MTMEESADLSMFDFKEGDAEARPRLMRKIRQSFTNAERKKQRKDWKMDEEWTPSHKSRTANVMNACPGSIKSRMRASKVQEENENLNSGRRKGVLEVQIIKNRAQVEEEDEEKSSRRISYERRQKRKEDEEIRRQQLEEEEDARRCKEEKEQRALLNQTLCMSRLHSLVFPPGDPDPVTITANDIEVLRPSAFLNDTIIDFYVKFLQTRTLTDDERKRCYFFNSFFFPKLVELCMRGEDGDRAAFAPLEKWIKEDMFEKDFIFIPVNKSCHWSLLVICYLNDICPKDPDSDIHLNSACILHFDSFDGFHTDIEIYIRNYLSLEWSRRTANEQQHAQYQFDQIKFIKANVPQQDNLSDCGLFLLHFVQLFLERCFSCPRGQFSFVTKRWFDPADASAKRKHLLLQIHEMYAGKLDSQGSSSFKASSSQSQDIDDEEELVMFHGSSP